MSAKTASTKSDEPKTRPERITQFSTTVDDESLEFIRAIEKFKFEKGRAFPSWTEVLTILKTLGYRKVALPGEPIDPPHPHAP